LGKIQLARLFGIQGISLWRLGQIPDYNPSGKDAHEMDIWQNILDEMEKK
jgi:spore germination protein YaaH